VKSFLAAIAFLTRLPIRAPFTAEDVGRGAIFFPLVGAGIGGLQWALWSGAVGYLTPLVAATLVVAFGAWLTRGLHWDGLADFVDGLGGGWTREDALRIMKDSRIGAFGGLALILVVVLKVAAIEALAAPLALIVAPALARLTPVILGVALPYARGSDAPSAHTGWIALGGSTATCVGLAWVLDSLPLLGVAVGVSVLIGVIARRRLGGVTGDVLGACVELSETAMLVVAGL